MCHHSTGKNTTSQRHSTLSSSDLLFFVTGSHLGLDVYTCNDSGGDGGSLSGGG